MSFSATELADKGLRTGDLLVCEGGEIGRAAVWSGQMEGVSFQNHLHRLRPLNDQVVPCFYAYFLQSAFTQLGLFEGAGNKTTIPNLSRNRLGALEVPVPERKEHQNIVRVLDQVRNAKRLNADAEASASALKRAAMRELFTRGLRGEEQKESAIGPIPATWNATPFQEVREWLQYGTSHRCERTRGDYPVLRIPNVLPGRVDGSDLKFCDMETGEAERYLLEPGDLLFIRTNGVVDRLGSCAVFNGEPVRALFASYLIRARVRTKLVNPRFAAYFFESERGTREVTSRATPAADGKYNLNTSAIDSFTLPLPPDLDEQRDIVEILDAIDQKIDLHKRKKAVLDELFKALLHKLMTGEIRVSDLDLSALEDSAPEEKSA
jgi:type I restriction enzyme S subunit